MSEQAIQKLNIRCKLDQKAIRSLKRELMESKGVGAQHRADNERAQSELNKLILKGDTRLAQAECDLEESRRRIDELRRHFDAELAEVRVR